MARIRRRETDLVGDVACYFGAQVGGIGTRCRDHTRTERIPHAANVAGYLCIS